MTVTDILVGKSSDVCGRFPDTFSINITAAVMAVMDVEVLVIPSDQSGPWLYVRGRDD